MNNGHKSVDDPGAMHTGTDEAASFRGLHTSWKKSSLSNGTGGNNCVEGRMTMDGKVEVRDSKDPSGPTLLFTRDEWRAFVGGVKDNEFNLP